MADRDTEYVIVRNRKPKKTRRVYYNEDEDYDEDDDDSQIHTSTTRRITRSKPHRRQQQQPRIKYISADEIDSDYRRQRVVESRDNRIQIRKTTNAERVILDEDDNIIKVIRNGRTPTPPPIEHRRLKHRPRESQTIFYETSDGHLISRPSKKQVLQTKKTQIIYADDEPTKVMKKVIIDPRTGERETFYEKEKPKKQHRYIARQRPLELLSDTDDDDDDDQAQYIRVVKQRSVPTQISPRHQPSMKYYMVQKKAESEPVYALSSKMPAIKNNRRVVYEVPAKKSLTTYVIASNDKYYK